MRWLLGRDPGTCAACGSDVERGAAWCGACGARLDASPGSRDDDEALASVAAEQDGPAATGGPAGGGVRRAGIGIAVGALLVAVVAAGVLREAPPAPLLGTTGVASGMSASGPPPEGLRLAWEHEVFQTDEGMHGWTGLQQLVVGADRVRVDHRVVDLVSGRLVRIGQIDRGAGGAVHAQLLDGQVVVVDTLTGRVVQRNELTRSVALDGRHALGRSGEVSLFAGDRDRVVFVGDDGSVLGDVAGRFAPDVDRADQDPAAFPLRRGTPRPDPSMGELAHDVALVAPDGQVVAEFEGPGQRIVDVVGDLALVATTAADAGRNGDGLLWSPTQLVDARTGEVLQSFAIAGSEAPRLLGTFGDGTPVMATRSGRELAVWALGGDDGPELLGSHRSRRTSMDAFFTGDSALLQGVAMDDEVVVVLDDDGDRLLGRDGEGATVWQVPAAQTAGIAVGDGHVALLPEDPGQATRVLTVADGVEVVRVPAADPGDFLPSVQPAPVAVLDGHVAVDEEPRFGGLQVQLGASTWLDLVTGERRPTGELFAPYAAEEEISGAWRLHGVATDPTTATSDPVVTRDLGSEVLQLLDPEDGLRSIQLDLPDQGEVAQHHTEFVGATRTHLALWAQGFDSPDESVTLVVDRGTGDVRSVLGVFGVALLDDLLLGLELDEEFSLSALTGVDPASGTARWARPLTDRDRYGFFGAPPLVDDDLLVLRQALAVEAVDLDDGQTAWRHDAAVELTAPGVLSPSAVVLVATDGEVVALDRRDGVVRWRSSVGSPVTAATGAGDDVLVGTVDGEVVHLAADGSTVQRIPVADGPVTAVAALGDTVVVAVDGRVLGLRADGTGVTRRDQVPLP